MKKVVKEGLIKAASVGKNKVKISHLQYADDTIFVVDRGVENVRALKWLLKNFKVVSSVVGARAGDFRFRIWGFEWGIGVKGWRHGRGR